MPTDEKIGNLEEEARKRKERLEALRNQHNQSQTNESRDKQQSLPKPKFRSYNPQTEELKQNTLPKAEPESVIEQIRDHLAAGKPEPLIEEVDLTSIAPRKIDWDLKRNLAKKIEKLERRTQKAIAELIRDRLKEEGNNDLVEGTQAMNSAKLAEEDDED